MYFYTTVEPANSAPRKLAQNPIFPRFDHIFSVIYNQLTQTPLAN